MATIARIAVAYTGFNGAPGVSYFYGVNAATFRPGLIGFWTAIAPFFASSVTITVPNTGDLVDDVTGLNTGFWNEGTTGTAQGSIAGSYSGASGAVVNWLTTRVIGGRRLRGKTFLVPLGGTQFDSDGSVAPTPLNAIRAAAEALVAASPGSMLILHRPTLAGSPSGATPGESAAVTSTNTPDLAAVLRSRRG